MSRQQHIEKVAGLIADEMSVEAMSGGKVAFDAAAANRRGWTYDLIDADRGYVNSTGYTRFEGVSLTDTELEQALDLAARWSVGEYDYGCCGW